MAKVTFNPDSPIQALSGTLGDFTFRTVYGRTHVFQRPEPILPKNPTRQQRELFKQRTVINNCINILQAQYEDFQEAIAMRKKIKERLTYLYKKHAPDIKAPTKLQRAIMTDYYARFSASSPSRSRTVLEPISNHSRSKRPSSHRQIFKSSNLQIFKSSNRHDHQTTASKAPRRSPRPNRRAC